MLEQLKGKVSEIIDNYVIAINIGKRNGVIKGMLFDVRGRELEIKDPDSDENLGTYIHVKARVEIVSVLEKFSLARNSKKEINFIYPAFKKKITKLPVEFTQINENIEIGDEVVQYIVQTYVKCKNCEEIFVSPIQIANPKKSYISGNTTICPHCSKETEIDNSNLFNK